jgi:hypothetical protein
MIPEEVPAVDEAPAVVEEGAAVEDVYGDAPPVDEYRLSRGPVVSAGS